MAHLIMLDEDAPGNVSLKVIVSNPAIPTELAIDSGTLAQSVSS
jgi:hypothetical protein